MLKKTYLAVVGLSACSAVFAGTMGPVCTPGQVTVPCEGTQWELGVQALYLKPTYTGYAANQITTESTYQNQPGADWGWGYQLNGGYHFNTGNDVSLSWMHYDITSTTAGLSGTFPFLQTQSYGYTLNNRFDQVNATFGQHVDFGPIKDAHFYAGLQYANIDVDGNAYLNNVNYRAFNSSEYKGVGPIVGVDYAYPVVGGLSVTANAASAVLFGSARTSAGLVAQTTGAIIPSIYGSRKSVVPSLDASLGLNYAHACDAGTLNIEGGYRVVNYFSALDVSDLAGNHEGSNFALNGPFIGLSWLGNA